MRILQLTDLHIFASPEETLHGVETRQSLKNVLNHIRARDLTFDFVIITGDHTHDEREESYQFVREQLSDWHQQLVVIPGNHDDRAILRTVLGDRVDGLLSEEIVFRRVSPGWTLLGLDTHVPGEVHGRVSETQIKWLRRHLQENADDAIAIFMHHPPIPIDSVWMDRIGLQDPSDFQSAIGDHSNVKLIVCGHVHHEFSGVLGSATIVATPSTGLQFDPTGDAPNFDTTASAGYRVLELNPDGTWTSEVSRVG